MRGSRRRGKRMRRREGRRKGRRSMESMMMNLYSSQREICLGQRFITKIFDRHFIHSHMYILTKVIKFKVKHFYMIL